MKARIGDTLKQTAEAYHLPLRGIDRKGCEVEGTVKVLAYQRRYLKWNIGRMMCLQKVLFEGTCECRWCMSILPCNTER